MATKQLIGNSLPYSVSLFDLVLGRLKQGADWETQCHREKVMSCLLHLPFRSLPFICFSSLWATLFKPEKVTFTSYFTLNQLQRAWHVRSDNVTSRAHNSSPQNLVCSMGCWRAFYKTEGLGCNVGRDPAILMIFSGCITISLEVPSVRQGHAIHCRECVLGACHLPSLPGISEPLKQIKLVATL